MSNINPSALEKISYGIFLLTSSCDNSHYGCIINTVSQATVSPLSVSVIVNKDSYTHDKIQESGKLAISVLTEDVPFSVIEHFGFQSGRTVDKFSDPSSFGRTSSGLLYESNYANAVFEADVFSTMDMGTHTLFAGKVTQSIVLSDKPSATYKYYHEHIKPKFNATKGYVCKICGYVYNGETLPADFVCPLCKHGVEAFEKSN